MLFQSLSSSYKHPNSCFCYDIQAKEQLEKVPSYSVNNKVIYRDFYSVPNRALDQNPSQAHVYPLDMQSAALEQLLYMQKKSITACARLPPELWSMILEYLSLQEMYIFRAVDKKSCAIVHSLLPVYPRSNLFKDTLAIHDFLASSSCKGTMSALSVLYDLIYSKKAKYGHIVEIKKILMLSENDREIDKIVDACFFDNQQKEKLKNTNFNAVQLRHLKQSSFILARVSGATFNIDAFLKIPDEDIISGIYQALLKNKIQVIQHMVESGIFLNSHTISGHAPLHDLGRMGNVAKLKTFFSFSPNAHIRDYDGCTALHHAARRNISEVVTYLLDRGLDAQSLDNKGCTPLLHAMKNHREKNAHILIERMTQFNHADATEMTAMHYAVQYHYLEHCLAMIDKNASVSIPNALGYTALHYAVIQKFSRFFSPLIEAGADRSRVGVDRFTAYVNQKDAKGRTALHHAAIQGDIDTVLFLRKHGAKIEAPDNFGRTPLHYAASNGYASLVFLVISSTVQDLTCHRGRTAMHYAALSGKNLAVRALLAAGAAFNKRDNESKSAFDYAMRYMHFKTAHILFTHSMRDFIKHSFLQSFSARWLQYS